MRADHFSGDAREYSLRRPRYPKALVDYVASLAPARGLVWDCATGNGQAASQFVDRFRTVVASDFSHEQLRYALRRSRVRYVAALAEEPPLADASVDLVTAASALHWLNHKGYFAAVRRVLRPGGVLACWGYHLHRVVPEVDAVVQRLYADVLGEIWKKQTKLLEGGRGAPSFPFEEITSPAFQIVKFWNLEQHTAYLETWSGAIFFKEEKKRRATDEVRDELASAWGDPKRKRRIVWDLYLRIGRKPAAGDPTR